ncbi:MAG: hypothetical protein JRF50_05945 [Deltaproteobacteria bacterium]|nr:hypothetical protein [Deltaproteobacteria bacterium]
MNHHHHEDTSVEDQSSLSVREKLAKLLEFWIKHNDDHANTYCEWSKKARSENLVEVVRLLEEASELTLSINELFKQAMKGLR